MALVKSARGPVSSSSWWRISLIARLMLVAHRLFLLITTRMIVKWLAEVDLISRMLDKSNINLRSSMMKCSKVQISKQWTSTTNKKEAALLRRMVNHLAPRKIQASTFEIWTPVYPRQRERSSSIKSETRIKDRSWWSSLVSKTWVVTALTNRVEWVRRCESPNYWSVVSS